MCDDLLFYDKVQRFYFLSCMANKNFFEPEEYQDVVNEAQKLYQGKSVSELSQITGAFVGRTNLFIIHNSTPVCTNCKDHTSLGIFLNRKAFVKNVEKPMYIYPPRNTLHQPMIDNGNCKVIPSIFVSEKSIADGDVVGYCLSCGNPVNLQNEFLNIPQIK